MHGVGRVKSPESYIINGPGKLYYIICSRILEITEIKGSVGMQLV